MHDGRGGTTVPGLFVARDATRYLLPVVVAAGEGAQVAVRANESCLDAPASLKTSRVSSAGERQRERRSGEAASRQGVNLMDGGSRAQSLSPGDSGQDEIALAGRHAGSRRNGPDVAYSGT